MQADQYIAARAIALKHHSLIIILLVAPEADFLLILPLLGSHPPFREQKLLHHAELRCHQQPYLPSIRKGLKGAFA